MEYSMFGTYWYTIWAAIRIIKFNMSYIFKNFSHLTTIKFIKQKKITAYIGINIYMVCLTYIYNLSNNNFFVDQSMVLPSFIILFITGNENKSDSEIVSTLNTALWITHHLRYRALWKHIIKLWRTIDWSTKKLLFDRLYREVRHTI